jgi:phosphoglycolate phosphatase
MTLNGWKPKLIIFDLDGTLIDSAPDIHYALNLCLVSLGIAESSLVEVKSWIGNGSKKLLERALIAKYRDFVDAETNETFFNIAHGSFLDFYEKNVSAKTAIYPNVVKTLQTLYASNIPMAMVTNKPLEITTQLLLALNWSQYFSQVVGGDSFHLKKPDPYPLQQVCKQHNLSASDCLMVGDSVNDIAAARSAGMPVLAVSYGYNHGQPVILENPDYLVADLNELLESLI